MIPSTRFLLFSALFSFSLVVHAADPAMVTCKDGTPSKGGQGACSGHGGIDRNGPPAGATARCKDDTYYLQKERRGACGKHGGVAQWLDKSASDK